MFLECCKGGFAGDFGLLLGEVNLGLEDLLLSLFPNLSACLGTCQKVMLFFHFCEGLFTVY